MAEATKASGNARPPTRSDALWDPGGRGHRHAPAGVVNPVASTAWTPIGYGVPASIAGLYQDMTEAIIDGRLHFYGGGRRVERETPVVDVLRGLLAGRVCAYWVGNGLILKAKWWIVSAPKRALAFSGPVV